MKVYYGALRRLTFIIAVAYGLIALFFLIISEDQREYQLLAVYDKALVYLLTPLFLLLSCRVEAVMGSTMAIRLGSRRRVLAVRLALHGMCAVFCSILWLAVTNLCAGLYYLAVTNLCAVRRYLPLLLRSGNISALTILCYIPLWLLLAEVSVLIGKLMPPKTAALSYAAGYLIFMVELMSLTRVLPRMIGLLFTWFYRGYIGAAALCVWCVILAAVLVRVCEREDIA